MKIKKEFKKGLEQLVDLCIIQNEGGGNYSREMYVDYNDDTSHMLEYLDFEDSKEMNAWIIEDILIENNADDYEYQYIREEAARLNIAGFEDFIDEMIIEGFIYVSFEAVIDKIFDEEMIFNIILTSYEERNHDLVLINDFTNNLGENNKRALKILKNTGIDTLLNKQGYTAEDLMDTALNGADNKFLNSILDELGGVYAGGQLLITDRLTLNDYFDLIEGKKDLIIEKEAIVGIADLYQGGGSYLSIELEKDFEIKGEEIFTVGSNNWRLEENNIQLIPDNNNYYYSLASIYGLSYSNYNNFLVK